MKDTIQLINYNIYHTKQFETRAEDIDTKMANLQTKALATKKKQ